MVVPGLLLIIEKGILGRHCCGVTRWAQGEGETRRSRSSRSGDVNEMSVGWAKIMPDVARERWSELKGRKGPGSVVSRKRNMMPKNEERP